MSRIRFKTWFPLLLIVLSSCVYSSQNSSTSSELPATYEPSSYRNTYKQARIAQGYKSSTPTIGDVPILVIPISFTDFPCADLIGGCQVVKDDIEKAFFEDEEDILWHSVASYYQASSYEQLRFYGEVSPWYTPSVSAAQLAEGGRYDVTNDVMRPAITWYRETYADNLTRLDTDGDGFIDAVYFIYSVPANAKEDPLVDDNRVFWAYTKYDNAGVANTDRPGVFHYGWSSYDFMYKDGYLERDEQGRIVRGDDDEPIFHPWTDSQGKLEVDAHTYIHEIGHFLGLPDYYTYDSDRGDWGSAGGIDMMDYNVGDHNGFSKAVFGWLTPKVVTKPTDVSLRPLYQQPDVAIIPINYDDTLLDEYLLIEYYQPQGLNKKDSLQQFAGYYPRTFSIDGIKIYHVDARLGRFIRGLGSFQFSDYVRNIGVRTNDVYYGIANSNTASRSAVASNKLLRLLEPDGSTRLRHGYVATNRSLFTEGMAFDETNYPNYTFNNGTIFNYSITIDTIDTEVATISISWREQLLT
ncbi:MAG TPA: hypothetical protein PK340_01490 [Bacilli bacterium]|nr:hypothetical protein [Bacilli bacterium]